MEREREIERERDAVVCICIYIYIYICLHARTCIIMGCDITQERTKLVKDARARLQAVSSQMDEVAQEVAA